MKCSVEDCPTEARARGFCQKHYKRWQSHGDPNYAKGSHDPMLRFKGMTKWVGDCLEWQGCRQPNGYGASGTRAAHRVAYELHKGPIPPGMLIMHSCDNPPCVNPDHLSVGTARDNVLDCINKGRRGGACNQGEKNNTTKLTEVQVLEIRRTHQRTFGENTRLAKIYGVNQHTISDIVKGKTWTHLL